MAAFVAAEVLADVGAGHAAWALADRLPEFAGERVTDGAAVAPAGGLVGVLSDGECGVEVLSADRVAAVEPRVHEIESDDVRLGAGGHITPQSIVALAEPRVVPGPDLARVSAKRTRLVTRPSWSASRSCSVTAVKST